MNKIRKKSRELDFSQEYMAMELGISQKAYSDIENGKTKLKMDVLFKIANILKVNPSELCDFSDNCDCIDEFVKNKHQKLVDFLKNNGIDFPENLI